MISNESTIPNSDDQDSTSESLLEQRMNLAYALEARGELFAGAREFQESSLAHSEASALFRDCAGLLRGKEEHTRMLLRQYVNARRTRKVM